MAPQAQQPVTLPSGLVAQLDAARAAAVAYHAITDTPIKELQTDDGSKRVGDLVTDARDKYRRWQSFGGYAVDDRAGGNYGGVFYYKGFGGGGLLTGGGPPQQGYIKSSRGRVIFSGPWRNERNWQVQPPFDDILLGDRIANIPALIGRIKR